MERHEPDGASRGSAMGAGPGTGSDDGSVVVAGEGPGVPPTGQVVPEPAEVNAHGDAVFAASPDAAHLRPVEAYLLEALERLDTAETKASQLEMALEHSREIGAAVGVLMALRKLTSEQAFDLLRRASMAQNVKVHVLASRVVETGSTDPA
ncbi:MAG: ANTAR domain-containing protein [Dermatophilaceae bacterium]|nr:ANTAR domain-containing protein [Dermatophilaceae bacterium]